MNFYYRIFHKSIICFLFFILSWFISFYICQTSYAEKIDAFSYKDVYGALPDKLHTADYVHDSGNIGYLSLATYNNSNYSTSVKKFSGLNQYLYCVNYAKHIILDTPYKNSKNLLNDITTAKVGLAFSLGSSKWNQKAHKDFTTGNAMMDYYMTQIVVHSLIYKYAGKKSSYGINFKDVKFKENTGTLKKKTTEFYNYCCDTTVYEDGMFEPREYAFNHNIQNELKCSDSGAIQKTVEVISNPNNAEVADYALSFSGDSELVSNATYTQDTKVYNSNVNVSIPVSSLDQLAPGVYHVSLSGEVSFRPHIASFWSCTTDTGSQEIGNMSTTQEFAGDQLDFEVIIGNIALKKKDAINGDVITDAEFELQQYNDTTQQYESYKQLQYDAASQTYISGNIYSYETNQLNRFRVIETKAGQNYINDWTGAEFQLSKDCYYYEFDVENMPILGSIKIHKKGEVFLPDEQKPVEEVALAGVCFGLYASEDIYLKDKILYTKDQKIVELITDSKGVAYADSLVQGAYYIKELSTDARCVLSEDVFNFSIQRDSSGAYNHAEYECLNRPKECKLELYKYELSDDLNKKIQLAGAEYGLYAQSDITNLIGTLLYKKDSLIEKKITNEAGLICFENLPYGNYYLKELKAPEGYVLDDTVINVPEEDFVLEKNDNTDSLISIAKKEAYNRVQEFDLRILKKGEFFVGANLNTINSVPVVNYKMDNRVLPNVKISLYNSNNELIQAKTTDEEGYVCFEQLRPGSYYYVEEAAPEEYIIEDNKTPVIFDNDHRNLEGVVADIPIKDEVLYNKMFSVSLKIKKLGEHFQLVKDQFGYITIPLKDVVFGIYQDFDYSLQEQVIPKDSCVGIITTDENGIALFDGQLPEGDYYIKELSTNSLYQLDDKKYVFRVNKQNNQNQSIEFSNGNTFTNELLKAAVRIHKTDENTGKSLKNVEFTLYTQEGQKIGVYRTDIEGNIIVNDLPYGKYYFVETKCKKGYYSTNNKFNFTLDGSDIVQLNITNSPILKLGFDEHYRVGIMIVGIILLIVAFCAIFGIKGCKDDKKHI